MKADFPEKLRKIRVLKNYSQEYVADKIGVSVSSYARYELGKVEIDFYSVASLAKLYKITIDQLVHFGDKGYQAEEPVEKYIPRAKVQVIVELDGLEDTLSAWFDKLTAINKSLA